jgi:hypothetical protein
MTVLELRAELLAKNTVESVSIAHGLMELPPYFTAETLRIANAAYARGVRLTTVRPGSSVKDYRKF